MTDLTGPTSGQVEDVSWMWQWSHIHKKSRKLNTHRPPSSLGVHVTIDLHKHTFIHKSASATRSPCLWSQMISLFVSRGLRDGDYLDSRCGSNRIDGVHSTMKAVVCIMDVSTVLWLNYWITAGHRWSQQDKQWHQLVQRSPDRKQGRHHVHWTGAELSRCWVPEPLRWVWKLDSPNSLTLQ